MELDDIDKRIIGALQVSGRASWRHISSTLDIPLTTVVRRGNALLDSGVVTVSVLERAPRTAVLEVRTEADKVDQVAAELADRPESVYVYVVGSPTRIVFEQYLARKDLAETILSDLPGVTGVTQVDASPVLGYHKTVAQWMPDLITEHERDSLNPHFTGMNELHGRLDADDVRILEALAPNGRATYAEVAEVIGMSALTVRRRLDRLVSDLAEIRSVVRAADIGLPVEAFLWITAKPADTREVAEVLGRSPYSKYVVTVLGESQIVADVAMPDYEAFRQFLSESAWAAKATSIKANQVVRTYKTGGIRLH